VHSKSRKPGEALAAALAAEGCTVSTEEAARLAAALLRFAGAGILVSPADPPGQAPIYNMGLSVHGGDD